MLELFFFLTGAGSLFFLLIIIIDNIKYLVPLSGFIVSYILCVEILKEIRKKKNTGVSLKKDIPKDHSLQTWPLTDRKMNIIIDEPINNTKSVVSEALKPRQPKKKRKKIVNFQHFFHSMHHTNFLFYYSLIKNWLKFFTALLAIYGIYYWLTLRYE